MAKASNEKKEAVLKYLQQQVEERGFPPSVREIRDALGFKSTSTVHAYIERLQQEGYLRKDAAKPRALKIYDQNPSVSSPLPPAESVPYSRVPVLGRITAGMPILAVENVEDEWPVPARYTVPGESFLLKVEGESMVEAGILDGDYILVRKQPAAENGEIVVAIVEDAATVKRFYKEKDHVRLQPENRFMDPLIIRGEVQVIGKVIGVMRFF